MPQLLLKSLLEYIASLFIWVLWNTSKFGMLQEEILLTFGLGLKNVQLSELMPFVVFTEIIWGMGSFVERYSCFWVTKKGGCGDKGDHTSSSPILSNNNTTNKNVNFCESTQWPRQLFGCRTHRLYSKDKRESCRFVVIMLFVVFFCFYKFLFWLVYHTVHCVHIWL